MALILSCLPWWVHPLWIHHTLSGSKEEQQDRLSLCLAYQFGHWPVPLVLRDRGGETQGWGWWHKAGDDNIKTVHQATTTLFVFAMIPKSAVRYSWWGVWFEKNWLGDLVFQSAESLYKPWAQCKQLKGKECQATPASCIRYHISYVTMANFYNQTVTTKCCVTWKVCFVKFNHVKIFHFLFETGQHCRLPTSQIQLTYLCGAFCDYLLLHQEALLRHWRSHLQHDETICNEMIKILADF